MTLLKFDNARFDDPGGLDLSVGFIEKGFAMERSQFPKKKIFVLDAFTNGYEAARKFIAERQWNESDCQIIFCGTNEKVLKRLTETASFAVVPVANSTIGEIPEITRLIFDLRAKGYDLCESGRINLHIKHCLLAPRHVRDLSQIERVISHERAIGQCMEFLRNIGFTPGDIEGFGKSDSTGNAAKSFLRWGGTKKWLLLLRKRRLGLTACKFSPMEYRITRKIPLLSYSSKIRQKSRV